MQWILICMPRWDKISSQLTYWAKAIMSFTWVISFSFFFLNWVSWTRDKGKRWLLSHYPQPGWAGHVPTCDSSRSPFHFWGRFSFYSPFCWRLLAQGGQISPLLSFQFHSDLFLINVIYLQQLLILIFREVIFFHWWFSWLLTWQQSHEVRSSVFLDFEAPVSGKSLLQYMR